MTTNFPPDTPIFTVLTVSLYYPKGVDTQSLYDVTYRDVGDVIRHVGVAAKDEMDAFVQAKKMIDLRAKTYLGRRMKAETDAANENW